MRLTLLPALLFAVACDEISLGSGADVSAEELGFGSMKVDGQPALGERPVLIVRLTYPDQTYRGDHADPAVLQELMYGSEPSVKSWFEANSNGAFTIFPGDTLSVEHPDTYECAQGWEGCTDPDNREDANHLVAHETAMKLAMSRPDFDFDRYDADGDGVVRQSELMVLFYHSVSDDPEINIYGTTGGIKRPFPSGCFKVLNPTPDPSLDPSVVQEREYCGGYTSVAEGVGAATVIHELSHLLETEDLYGTTCRSSRQSVMSCTVSSVIDDHEWIHFDPWHKLKLGWLRIDGYVVDHDEPFSLNLRSAEDDPRVIALFDEALGLDQFQIVERRDPSDLHDADNSGEGVAIWQVVENRNKVAAVDDNGIDEPGVYLLSAPDHRHSGSRTWDEADGDIELEWHDGTPTGAVLQIDPLEEGKRRITVER